MQTLLLWINANPMAFGVMVFILFFATLMTIIGVQMKRAGVSLKPLVFFIVFMGIVAGPQAVYHLTNTQSSPAEPPKQSAAAPTAQASAPLDQTVFGIADDRFVNPKAVFGPDVDTTLIVPVKQSLAQIFDRALAAEMAASLDGIVFAAVFPDAKSALDAQDRYAQIMAVENAIGDDSSGYIGDKRSSNERVQMIASGPVFIAWTAQNDEGLATRRATLATALNALPTIPTQPVAASTSGIVVGKVPFGDLRLALAFLAINLMAAILWFFKGTAWATKTPPAPGATPISAATLRERLLAVNQADVPVTVTVSDDDNTIDVTWRYADARWLDHASAHGMRRIHRLSLTLDEPAHIVRVREFMAAVEWSAGINAANINWRAATGIQFFQYEHQRVFGLQVGPDGTITGNLSYAYTFNLQELKAPFIESTTKSGWTWRPVFLNAPTWLRWLTE